MWIVLTLIITSESSRATACYIDCRSLGSVDRRNVLLSLAKSKPVPTDPYLYITDERIVANGFAIRQQKGELHVLCLENL